MLTWLAGCALLDADPPVLAVEERDGALAIDAMDERPGLGALTMAVDGGAPVAISPGTVPLDLADGPHEILVAAVDGALRRNRAEARIAVVIDRTPPALSIAPVDAAQGNAAAVWVTADEPLADGVVAFGGAEHRLYAVGERWRAVIGVPIEAEPGDAALTVVAHDRRGNEGRATATVAVRPTTFAEGGFIRLTATQVRAREDDEARARMRAERDAAYAYEQPEQRWTGPFLWPVADPRVTSPFGKYRRYSTGDRSHHTGVDLGARRGTPVVASADGRVVVAGEEAIFGNVVIVHHGQGVSTSYNHLDRVDVAVGQEVHAGDVLGAVGATGQATGPHLHWGLVVGTVAVDPAPWTASVP